MYEEGAYGVHPVGFENLFWWDLARDDYVSCKKNPGASATILQPIQDSLFIPLRPWISLLWLCFKVFSRITIGITESPSSG